MAKYPYLPLWTDAYLADTTHLTFEEHGVYLLLLTHAWRTPGCHIPNDPKWIARKLRIDADQYKKIVAPILSEFFESTGNYFFQKRLKKEMNFLLHQSEKQRARSLKRWDKTKNTHATSGNAASGNASTPTPTPIKERLLTESKESATRSTRLTLEALPETWAAWALENTDQDPTEVWPNFRDYWIAQPGQRGVKRGERGWFATWRNWCRKNDKQKSNGKTSSYSDLLARTQRVTDQLMKGSDDELPNDDNGEANGGTDSRKLPRHTGKP